MSIGSHSVVLIPDPDVQAWGPELNVNPFFTTDIAGYTNQVGGPPWHWSAGQAVNNAVAGAGANLILDPANPILRGASTMFRVRARVTVPQAGWVVVGLNFGSTPNMASYNTAGGVQKNVWNYCQNAGSYVFDLTVDPSTVSGALIYVAPVVAFSVNQTVSVDSLQLNGQGSELVDISCLVDQVAISHGRQDTDSQPEASSCTLDMSLNAGDTAFPASLDVGGIIRVTTTLGSATSIRFTGRITDLAQGWEDAGPDTPEHVVAQVIATSYLADLGRRVVGDAPWPAELDGARVSRIMTAAGITLDPTTSDPGTVQILARDVDSQPALDLAQAVAADAGGLVWATKSGDIRYADSAHRRGATSALTLDSCDVLVTPTWRRTTEGLINEVSIGYGVAPEGSDQPRYTGVRTDSQDKYGEYGFTTTTQLAALADATAMGQLLLTRNHDPVWIMSALPLDMKGLSDAETITILGLEIGDLITLTGLPAAGSLPTSALLWVEGWTETLGWGQQDLTLTVSGYCRTVPAPRWNDLDSSVTWDSMGAMTWDDATCMGPQPNHGRWDDVPASSRWNQLPPTQTWDTWPTPAA